MHGSRRGTAVVRSFIRGLNINQASLVMRMFTVARLLKSGKIWFPLMNASSKVAPDNNIEHDLEKAKPLCLSVVHIAKKNCYFFVLTLDNTSDAL